MGLFGRKKKEDELKDELAQAKKEAEASKKAIKDMLDQNTQTQQVKAEAERKAAEAEKKIQELESKVKGMSQEKVREDMAEARQKAMDERRAKLESVKKAEVMATHTVQEGETLSHIALKYYKHATPPYWQLLLEHNTEVLQGNERSVRTGMELEIPELPEDLKD
jgi:nucleoid-associated protein YgaU